MPVGFNSAARNLFLLGSSGADLVTNFFKTIDRTAGTDGVYLPDEIKYNIPDQKYILAGTASDSQSKDFGWVEKRTEGGVADWEVKVESTLSTTDTTLRALEIDNNDNLIVVGKTGTVPWVAKYTNGGGISWQSTTNTADLEYTGIAIDSNNNIYACGNTPTPGNSSQAFVEKFDSSGVPGWGKSAFMLGRDVILTKCAANSRGEVVAVGIIEDDSAFKGYIVKIDTSTGEVLWDRTIRSYNEDATLGYEGVFCEDVYVDGNDQIYVVGRLYKTSEVRSFIIKYTPEGNMIWQKETPAGETIEHYFVRSDTETEQTVVYSQYFGLGGMISKYSKNGDLVFRRVIYSSFNSSTAFGPKGLDADPSNYYLLFVDDPVDLVSGDPKRYTFGKVSSSGNGLGNFTYSEGTGQTIYYQSSTIQDKIGRLSDGSVRQDTSDLVTYPFNANKILFDDLATQVSNKKRQMDTAGIFEYSGSPAIRPADFQELNLLGDVYSGSGNWLDQSGKGNDGVVNGVTHNAAGYWEFDGVNDYIQVPTINSTIEKTYSIWATLPASGEQQIFSIGNSSSTCIGLTFNSTRDGNSQVVASSLNYGTVVSTGSYGVSSGITTGWHNFTITTNSSGNVTALYIDAVSYPSRTEQSRVYNLETTTKIGDRSDGNFTYSGSVGDILFYPRALTPAQVFQNYNATKSKYINEAPSIAPKIGPGIVYDSSLLLNYDFGNRATYDRAENLISNSEIRYTADGGIWQDLGRSTLEYGFDDPFGTKTATKVTKISGDGLIRLPNYTLLGNGPWTFSVYAKSISGALDQTGGLLLDISDNFPEGNEPSINVLSKDWRRYKASITPASINGGAGDYLDISFEFNMEEVLIAGAQLESNTSLTATEAGRFVKTSGTAITAPTTVKNLSSSSYPSTISGAEFNSAGYFVFDNANNDEIITSQTTVADTGMPGLTVEVWANLSSSTVFGSGGQSWIIGEEGRWRMTYDDAFTDGAFYFVCATTNNGWFTSGTSIFNYSPTYMFNGWHHFVGVYDGSNVRMYYDGGLGNVNSTTISGNVLSSGDPVLSIMGTDAANVGWGTGSIGQVRIYNRGLTATEVSKNFNATRAKYGV